jgi:hypothetical protein
MVFSGVIEFLHPVFLGFAEVESKKFIWNKETPFCPGGD